MKSLGSPGARSGPKAPPEDTPGADRARRILEILVEKLCQLGFLLIIVRCDPHMNELPVPCRPWKDWYDKKQKFYRRTLKYGALWFIFTIVVTIWTNSLFFNWAPPVIPDPPLEMIEECTDSNL